MGSYSGLRRDVVPHAADNVMNRRKRDRRGYGHKQINPKDAVASTKVDVGTVPDSLVFGASLAFLEGAAKYGQFNWRLTSVKYSVYDGAAQRHRAKYRAGETMDPKTKVPHHFSVIACYAIIEDARLSGTLIDDRPVAQPALIPLIDKEYVEVAANIRRLFRACKPRQNTALNS